MEGVLKLEVYIESIKLVLQKSSLKMEGIVK